MTVEQKVIITNKKDLYFEAQLQGCLEGELAKIDLTSDLLNFSSITAVDFWECLLKIRHQLEEKNLFILCQGSAKNVHPSGMVRQMSLGQKVYLLEIGKKPSFDNLVAIFAPSPVDIVSTVAEQKQFFEDWIKSSKN